MQYTFYFIKEGFMQKKKRNDIYSIMKYDDIAPGDTITLEAYVYVYKGEEGTIGVQRSMNPDVKIEITLP